MGRRVPVLQPSSGDDPGWPQQWQRHHHKALTGGVTMNIDLSGKTALVTGGSYGLGVVWATALAEAGASIALTARSADLLEKVAIDLGAMGCNVSIHPGDVTQEDDVERVVAEVVSHHGQLDVLVNNAGVSEPTGRSSEQTTSEHFRHAVEVDLVGVWNYASIAGRHMLARRS